MYKDKTQVLIFQHTGHQTNMNLSEEEFLSMLKEYKLSSRDLKLLLRSSAPGRVQHPAILPRPESDCIIFLVEHVKMICFIDQCIILTPHDKKTVKFVESLKNILNFKFVDDDDTLNMDSMKLISQISRNEQDFEHIVIEKAIESVVEKFTKHLQIVKPALDVLLQEIEDNAETNGLKKLLAVKKSLAQFQQNVDYVIRAVSGVMEDSDDIANMKLRPNERGDIEQIFDSFSAEMDEIDAEIKTFTDMIEDTDQFVSAHLDSVRNEIMKMSLCIEVGALVMGFGAVVGGAFGMNLKFDEVMFGPNSFFIVVGVTVVLMLLIAAGFVKKYYELKKDTSSAQTFNLLKNFFTYVDDLEYHLFNKNVNKVQFKDAVEKITNLKVSEKESDYLFQMVDANNDGVIDAENELNLDLGVADLRYTHPMENGTRL